MKAFWRNVMVQLGRNAELIAAVVTFAKLVVSQMQRGEFCKNLREHELLRIAARIFEQEPVEFLPLLDVKVDATVRKRPASPAAGSRARGTKRVRRR